MHGRDGCRYDGGDASRNDAMANMSLQMSPDMMANDASGDDGPPTYAARSDAGHGCRYDGNDASRDDGKYEPRDDGKYAAGMQNGHDGNGCRYDGRNASRNDGKYASRDDGNICRRKQCRAWMPI